MRLLIVKLGAIGDIVHALPALAAIRSALPGAEISWAVERRSAEILRGNELIDDLVELDTRALRSGRIVRDRLPEASRQWNALRAREFDVALDFQGLLKSAMIAKLSGAPRRCGFSRANMREPASRFLLTETFDVPPRTHIIRKNLILAENALQISVPLENFAFPIFTDESHRLEAANIADETGENYAILNPAGGWTTKLWHAEKFGALADRLWEENGLMSVVTTAPNERELAEKALSNSKSGKVLTAQPSLKGFYELAKLAKIYIGGDTGPTHLAIAARAPVVGILGPTEWWRNGSPNVDDICVERLDIGCRAGCHRRNCSNWICLDIQTETVLRAVQKRIASIETEKTKQKNRQSYTLN